MYVTIELQKFPASQFFRWDLKLYDADRDLPARDAIQCCREISLRAFPDMFKHIFATFLLPKICG